MGRVLMVTLVLSAGLACSDDSSSSDAGAEDQTRHSAITIVATNKTQGPIYVDWRWSPRGLLSCGLQNGAAWDSCSFFSPGCMEPCSAANKGNNCCLGCGPPIDSVKKLAIGDTVSATWAGEAWDTVKDHCSDSCSCYWTKQAPGGRYRAEICVHDGYTCGTGTCPDPDQNGVITSATPSGTETCFNTEFDLPYAGDKVEITIQ